MPHALSPNLTNSRKVEHSVVGHDMILYDLIHVAPWTYSENYIFDVERHLERLEV